VLPVAHRLSLETGTTLKLALFEAHARYFLHAGSAPGGPAQGVVGIDTTDFATKPPAALKEP
jgi:hypothetical protein